MGEEFRIGTSRNKSGPGRIGGFVKNKVGRSDIEARARQRLTASAADTATRAGDDSDWPR